MSCARGRRGAGKRMKSDEAGGERGEDPAVRIESSFVS